ncbi:hypothetical protein K402DRAFT_359896 [Aulographum hederae CBS 113979]|uniref:SEC7 domain-containing protein n=1 Tax=Aulographum hederae CBS 113979 TaxID=1176131 RepID=A0A6G1GTE8_9PEZI|nr:hypothetical protein K402DRAFT_359896 [Aulographum hederae CBS 113979]
MPKTRTPAHRPSLEALHANPVQRETFLDDDTPLDHALSNDADLEHDTSRDSHDLSLLSNRDSVVDHMLISLDSMSNGSANFPSPAAALFPSALHDDFVGRPTSPKRSNISRRRNHSHAASVGSAYDSIDDTATLRGSHRSRRQNSANSDLTMDQPEYRRHIGYASAKSSPEKQRDRTTRRRKHGSNKSSATSSVDHGYAMGSQQRSAMERADSVERQNHISRSILDRGRPHVENWSPDDSAPVPTVPAGPWRRQDAENAQRQDALAHHHTVPTRRTSLRSGTSRIGRQGAGERLDATRWHSARDYPEHEYDRDDPQTLQSRPYSDVAAPAPTVGTRTASVPSSNHGTANKERPGFFRRVFGSSKASSSSQHHQESSPSMLQSAPDHAVNVNSPLNPQTPKRPRTQNSKHISNQVKEMPKTPAPALAQGVDTPSKEEQVPTLHKKSSNFFRRRKKSMSDGAKPPVPPLQLQHSQVLSAEGPVQPSPSVSSLRKVMDPYLTHASPSSDRGFEQNGSVNEQLSNGANTEQTALGFSQGYIPHRYASARAVNPGPGSRDTNNENSAPSSRGDVPDARPANAMAPGSPKFRMKMRRGRPNTAKTADEANFLAESSGNEDRFPAELSANALNAGVSAGVNAAAASASDYRRPKTSPTAPMFAQPGKENLAVQYKSKSPSGSRTRDHLSPISDHSPQPSEAGDQERPASDRSTPNEYDDEGWVVAAPKKHETATHTAKQNHRVWLDDDSFEEKLNKVVPVQTAVSKQAEAGAIETPISPSETIDIFHSATSLPIVQIDGVEGAELIDEPTKAEAAKAIAVEEAEPTLDDRKTAERIFSGDELAVSKNRAAAWLGEATFVSARTRKAYMELFDWTGMNILSAFRALCAKILMKAESQALDRVIDAFTKRWCECNANHGFKADDVVHTMTYSILMLNTDLHMADMDSKMSRSQFVKNTLPTIRRIAEEGAKEEDIRRSRVEPSWVEDTYSPVSPSFPPETGRSSQDARLSTVRKDSDGPDNLDSCNILVKAPFKGSTKDWEFQVEIVLKEFYNSIRNTPLPLHGAAPVPHPEQSSNSLSVMASSMLRRTPSVISKAPSDSTSYRGRSSEFRSHTSRFPHTKNRNRPRLYQTSTIGSSRTSLDDSLWSPTGSTTWSKYSLGKTGTSMSVETLGSHFTGEAYPQSIGFANALSQAIIREEGVSYACSVSDEPLQQRNLLEDETLELAGAPWAKEGMLRHKHHLETKDKRSKHREWVECFAVVEKGWVRLFSFTSSKSMRIKNKNRSQVGGIVGGGNWTENAEQLGSFMLRQSIASVLPAGYSKSRPHVWALTLPTGAVHLFQVGTPDIIKEFVSTANYWSARLSKEPLIGGVSNIEYGWSDALIMPGFLMRENSIPGSSSVSNLSPPGTSGSSVPRHTSTGSISGSIRSSFDHGVGSSRPRLPGDKIVVNDWTPPVQSMMASQLLEVDQLNALETYVEKVKEEFATHNELRVGMSYAFSHRHPNYNKALSNWEKKSQYLLTEVTKFQTYVDALKAAQKSKEKVYEEREEALVKEGEQDARQFSVSSGVDDVDATTTQEDGAVSGSWFGTR